MTMKTYNLFVASSMKSDLRDKINNEIVSEVNRILKGRGLDVACNVSAYSHNPSADMGPDTQKQINDKAAKSDLFIMLADNNTTIGKYTMQEYEVAQEQSTKNNGAPYIKTFIIKEKKEDAIKVSYCDMADKVHPEFEKRIDRDSKRYMECRVKDGFLQYFKEWLELNIAAHCGLITQSQLSYNDHIYKIGQGSIRRSDHKYYFREKLDGEIANKFGKFPIVILEGNTYSGKTRAAYEFMRNQEEWKDWNFHIYNSNHCVKNLNDIRLNCTERSNGDVYLIDDINDIICKQDAQIDRSGNTIWNKLNGYNKDNGFSLQDMGRTRIIITISGRLSEGDRFSIYKSIFNVQGDRAIQKIKQDIVIDFDQPDRKSFHEMVDNMVRDGVIKKSVVIKGNYTIGSLFIKTEDVKSQIRDFLEIHIDEKGKVIGSAEKQKLALLQTIVGHCKYAMRSKFAFSKNAMAGLYQYLKGEEDVFDTNVDQLRQKGLVVVDKETVFVDQTIIGLFAEVLHNECGISAVALNGSLIAYAVEPPKDDTNHAPHLKLTKCRMGYLLCDRNTLPDDEIADLVKKVRIKNDVNTCKREGFYGLQFFATAYSRIQNFERVKQIIEKKREDIQSQEGEEDRAIALALYKKIVYAMFSKNNRVMTLSQEREMLNLIFDENKQWNGPFSEDDLKDIFNLARISPFIDLTLTDALDYVSQATIDGQDMSKYIEKRDNLNAKDPLIDEDYDEDDNESEAEIGGEDYYKKVFLNKIGQVLISTLCKSKSYDEIQTVLDEIKKRCEASVHLQNAVQNSFSYHFYKDITNIAKGLPYEDRYALFKFVCEINEASDLFGSSLCNYTERRIHALNRLLVLLNEGNALEACISMFGRQLSDLRTLSHLLKNEFLQFEQVLPLIEKYEEQKHFLTLNQMMGKVETISDAHTCMRLMGIKNGNPSKLKDEYALSQYIAIKEVSREQTIKILQGWRELYPNNQLSEQALNPILQKFSLDELFDIIKEEMKSEEYYRDRYGFILPEIKLIRNNAALINILFSRANNSTDKAVPKRIRELFRNIRRDDERRELLTNPEKDRNNSILSVYLKNKSIFPNYHSIKRFSDKFFERYKVRKTNYIYKVYLYEKIANNEGIDNVNAVLNEAYNDFAVHYTREEVVKMIAKLYSYIPKVVEGDFDTQMKFAYEDTYAKVDGREEISFKEYLNFLLENNPAYVDSAFIYQTLCTMQEPIDEEVYELLGELAQRNHCGVKYDTIYKNDNYKGEVRNRLLSYENGELKIDHNLVSVISPIKVLWFMVNSGAMTFDEAEDYRKKNNIPVTQTYLNFAFKTKENSIFSDKHSRYKSEVLSIGFDNMKTYMEDEMQGKPYLHKSIQMCISLIKVAPDIDTLDKVFNELGFGVYRAQTEAIGVRMKNIIKLRYRQECAKEIVADFQKEIKDNRDEINITIINTYLSALLAIDKGEIKYEKNEPQKYDIKDTFAKCWETLNSENKIDVNELLGVQSKDGEEVEAWKIDADVQTFSYFAMCCKTLISTMDKKFNGNFCYDEKGKKSCLKDAIKNYSFYKNATRYTKDREAECISKLLAREENWSVRDELFDEYILQSKYNERKEEWNRMNELWVDLLRYSECKKALVHRICNLALEMAKHTKYKRHKFSNLDLNDNVRICTLQKKLAFDTLGVDLQNKITNCLTKIDEIIADPAVKSKRNAQEAQKRVKLIFNV